MKIHRPGVCSVCGGRCGHASKRCRQCYKAALPKGITQLLEAELPREECWEWTGALTASGYGNAWHQQRNRPAHRLMYELVVGPIPEGRELDHLCRNTRCVNPGHLEPVTHRENILRGTGFAAIHAAKTHCPAGHQYDEANTYVYRGMRNCRACKRQRDRSTQETRRAA